MKVTKCPQATDVSPLPPSPMEAGRLPQGWVLATVGDLGEYLNGLAFKPSDWEEQGRPIIRIQNLTGSNSQYNYTTRPVSEQYTVHHGDLLVSWSATLDAYVWKGPEAVLNQHIFKVTPEKRIVDPDFLYWGLRYTIRMMSESEHTHGSTMKHINRGPFLAHPFRLPPLPEQRRIASRVREMYTVVETTRETLDELMLILDRYRRSVLAAAFRGDLTADWREEQPDLQSNFPTPHSAGPVPRGWSWVPLGELIAFGPQNGLYIPQSSYGQGSPIIRIDDFRSGTCRPSAELKLVDIGEVDRERFEVHVGDLIINRVNSLSHLGKSMVVRAGNTPAVFESNMMRLRLAEEVNSDYILHYLQSTDGRKALVQNAKWAVNQASINQSDVRAVLIPLPSPLEQGVIVSRLNAILQSADRIGGSIATALKQCDKLEQAILAKAFRGELVPQDPDDEPASVILERIRDARAIPPDYKPRKRRFDYLVADE